MPKSTETAPAPKETLIARRKETAENLDVSLRNLARNRELIAQQEREIAVDTGALNALDFAISLHE